MLQRPRFCPHFQVERVAPDQVFLISERDRFFLQGPLYYHLAPLLTGPHSSDEIATTLADRVPYHQVYYALMQLEKKGYVTDAHRSAQREDTENAPASPFLPSDIPLKTFVTPTAPEPVKLALTRFSLALKERLRGWQAAAPSHLGRLANCELVLTDDYLHPQLEAYNRTALQLQRPWLLVRPLGEEIWIGPIFDPLSPDRPSGCWDCLAQRLRGNRPVQAWLAQLRAQQRSEGIQQAIPPLSPDHQAIALELILQILKELIWGESGRPDLPETDATKPGLSSKVSSGVAIGQAELLSHVFTFDPKQLTSQAHPFIARPQCWTCSAEPFLTPEQRAEQLATLPPPFVLQSCPKTFTADGGHRSLTPSQTLQRLQRHISPITGVVRELRAVAVDGSTLLSDAEFEAEPERTTSGLVPDSAQAKLLDSKSLDSNLLHTYVVAHDTGDVERDLEALKLNLQGRSAGKGKTRTQAKVSGICEAIERYSGIFQGDERRCRATYLELGDRALHPNAIMRFSEAQYCDRDQWNPTLRDMRHYVPEPFDPEAEVEWTPVWSLTEERYKYLPTAFCYYSYPGRSVPEKQRPTYCRANSNGCAAGNTREEAILQGFLELVERDAVAIWWNNQIRRPEIDLTTFEDPYFAALQQHYLQAFGRALYVLDLTHDLGVPAVAAVSHLVEPDRDEWDEPDQKILCGFGAHFEGAIAISRALTEVNQLITGSVDPKSRTTSAKPNPQASPPGSESRTRARAKPRLWLVDQLQLVPDLDQRRRTQADFPALRRPDIRDDVLACRDIVARQGLEMLVLDQTRPDIGLPVMRVMVPGMRHFWRRLAPGRLYDVPEQLGWQWGARSESEMNPLLFPF